MTIYLINIFLILFWGYVFLHKEKSDNNTKLYCGLVAFQWILISGLRHWSIGDDTAEYSVVFERVKSTSWSTIFNNIWDYLFHGLKVKDPGYALVEKTFQIFCRDYQVFLIFIALFFTSIMAIWIYRNSADPCFSFILYSVLFYTFYAVTGIRQTIATALVVFIGYKYIKERKLVKFALLAFAAYLIHKSSVVFVPFYFVANIPITVHYIIFAIIVILIIVVSGKSIYGAIAEWLGYGEEQVNYTGGGAETYATVLTLLCLIILFFYIYYKDRHENSRHIFNITLLTLMSSLLIYQNQGFMRIQQYYSLFLMVTFPEVINSFEKESRVVISFATISFLIFYLVRNNPQYLFFWQ